LAGLHAAPGQGEVNSSGVVKVDVPSLPDAANYLSLDGVSFGI
jgi:hypothetical protein